jgi:hypothetical protein
MVLSTQEKMGNFGSSAAEITPESLFIASVEEQLGVHAQSCRDVDDLLRRYVVGGRIHRRAVLKAERDLHLPPSQVLSGIYEVLSVGTDYVDSKTLLYFYICLASGSAQQKAEQIWTLFDPEVTGDLTSAMLKDLLETAVRCAVDLAAFVVKKHENFAEERLTKWREDLKNRKGKALEMLTTRFLAGNQSVSRVAFFHAVLTLPELDITNLLKVRTQIEKISYVQFVAKSAFKNFKKS